MMPKEILHSLCLDLIIKYVVDVLLHVLPIWYGHGVICSFAEDLDKPLCVIFEPIQQCVCVVVLQHHNISEQCK